jgi:xanthine dehydrogenase YagR molybdenum-binding subunit
MSDERTGTSGAAARVVGAPLDRIDGRQKVTGAARYAAEFQVPDVAHVVMITSTIAKGRVRHMDTAAAERTPGVLAVLTPFNAPRLAESTGVNSSSPGQPPSRVPTLLQDDRVHYNGQPIGLVVADTFEHATAAAHLVRITYDEERPDLDVSTGPKAPGSAVHPTGAEPKATARGDVVKGLAAAAVTVDHTYTTPLENHNPMEPHNTLAVWEGDRLTLYDSTQGIFNVRNAAPKAFGIPRENVRVVSYFTGGGFGSKGGPWSHVFLAAMAARHVNRPAKLFLTRRQMFGPVGGRPLTIQHVTLAATRDGTLTAIRHTSVSNTSTLEDWLEPAAIQTRMLYEAPNVETDHDLVRLNLGSPTFQRAPGEATGTFALESAMDELAVALKMDPVELRLKNYAERDPQTGKPFSSKSLRECYRQGAERFGWNRRNPEPRSMRDGHWLVGYGMATATYPARQAPASAVARVLPDGSAEVRAGTQEIGCGTYTIMAEIAADALGLPPDHVKFGLRRHPAAAGATAAT